MTTLLHRLAEARCHHLYAVLCLLLSCLLCAVPTHAKKPLRVICIESGPLHEYNQVLLGMAEKLFQMNFLDAQPPRTVDSANGCRDLWSWLGKHSDHRVQFLQDGFYSAAWEDRKRKEIRQAVMQRLETQQDVDAILVFGTRCGQDFAKLPTKVPVIVLSVTDAVGAGIVPSVADSGKDNLVALVNPWRYQRQVEFFHQFFPFRKLGVVYENTPTGRNVVALPEIEAAATSLGVELVPCHTSLHDSNLEIVVNNIESCHRQLVAQHVDAVYLTLSVAMTQQQIRYTLRPLLSAKIPTFSQSGLQDVKSGALICFAESDMDEGRRAAQILRSIMDGVLPRGLSQRFSSPLRLAINLRTAAMLGWNPPLELLLIVDEFYE